MVLFSITEISGLPHCITRIWGFRRIEVAGKKIVYSGDIARLSELDALVDCGCDMLICESGHQKVAEILAYAEKKGIQRLRFIHHGREIINDRAAAEELAKQYPHSAIITYDGMTEEI